MKILWFEEEVKRGAGQKSTKPTVSISKAGLLSFNKYAVETFNLAAFSFIKFGVDEDKTVIAFSFSDEKEKGSYKLNVKETGATASVKSFLNFYDLAKKESRRFELLQDEKSKTLYIELSQAQTTTRKKK